MEASSATSCRPGRVAVRAQMGRVPLHRLPRRRLGPAPVEGRQAARADISPTWSTALALLGARRFVLDGEITVPVDGRLSFDELLQRIHPAESRVRKLAAEHPARFVVFDLLVDERGKSLVDLPLAERRQRLEAFAQRYFPRRGRVRALAGHAPPGHGADVARAAADEAISTAWWPSGIDLPYRTGERDGMVKVKRAADRRLCRRRVPLRQQGRRRRLAAARTVRRRGAAASCRFLFRHRARRAEGADAAGWND